MNNQIFKLFIFFSVALLVAEKQASACPLCKEAVARLGEAWTAIGFNWSIIFMLSVPIVLVGSFVFALVRHYKKYSNGKLQ